MLFRPLWKNLLLKQESERIVKFKIDEWSNKKSVVNLAYNSMNDKTNILVPYVDKINKRTVLVNTQKDLLSAISSLYHITNYAKLRSFSIAYCYLA